MLGTLAVEGSVIKWVADHRKHHDFADEEATRTARTSAATGARRAARPLHAHVGWLFNSVGLADRRRYAADLLRDRGMRRRRRLGEAADRGEPAVPFAIGYAVKGSLGGALITLVWGGLARIFLLHHATFSINSICHFFGRRRFDTRDESTNVVWLAPLTFGESWHNNHHAFPTSAFHGLRRRELDIGGLVISGSSASASPGTSCGCRPSASSSGSPARAAPLGGRPRGSGR